MAKKNYDALFAVCLMLVSLLVLHFDPVRYVPPTFLCNGLRGVIYRKIVVFIQYIVSTRRSRSSLLFHSTYNNPFREGFAANV